MSCLFLFLINITILNLPWHIFQLSSKDLNWASICWFKTVKSTYSYMLVTWIYTIYQLLCKFLAFWACIWPFLRYVLNIYVYICTPKADIPEDNSQFKCREYIYQAFPFQFNMKIFIYLLLKNILPTVNKECASIKYQLCFVIYVTVCKLVVTLKLGWGVGGGAASWRIWWH